jgi:glutamate synthase domain-containing protein 2
MPTWLWIVCAVAAFVLAVVIYDVTQRRRAILHNFPIIGHFRYIFVKVGPELRQYIVTGNDEERPFSRDQRRWVYASSKKENNYFGFGTDNDLEQTPSYLIIRHAAFPVSAHVDAKATVPCGKILGGKRGRAKAFRPASIVNMSAMSYGSLSGAAVEALNRGVALAGALQNTGEGGISDFHRKGGELIWQIGTGYFGCRDEHGRFSMERFLASVASAPVRAIGSSRRARSRDGRPLAGGQVTPDRAHPRRAGRRTSTARPATAFTTCRRCRLSSVSPTPPGCRSGSRARSASSRSGTSWRARCGSRSARPTSSRSTAARAAPGRRRWCSAITSPCRGSSASRRCTARSPRRACTRTSCSSAPASSGSRRPRCSRSRWAPI